MKKNVITLLVIIAINLQHCKPSDDPIPKGASSGDITISSISPETFYADEELVITGTGFNTDPNKLKVEMGFAGGGNFVPFAKTFDSDPSFTIVSSTTTKIVAKAVEKKTIDFEIRDDYPYRIRVTSDGKTALGAIKHSRSLPAFTLSYTDAIGQVQGCFFYLQAGDSVHMTGHGFNGNCSVYIDNQKIPETITHDNNNIYFKIPKDFFGELDDNCTEKKVIFKVENEDAKIYEGEYHVATSPPMEIYSAIFDKSTYSASDMIANLSISGYSLYSKASLKVTNKLGYSSESAIGALHYINSVKVPISVKGLDPGDYEVRLRKNPQTDYGFFAIATFTISN